MAHAAGALDFLRELRRVLGLGPAGTDFFAWSGDPSADQLRRMTAWLRRQPSGLGEAELERRLARAFGPPPA
jgi:hypothetical protein